MKPSDNIAVAVYGEQVAAVYWQMPIALGANFVNAALTAAVLTPIGPGRSRHCGLASSSW